MTDTVLVVDDTPSKRYLLASWLRRGGYTVVEAATGAEALTIFHRDGADLVVLDVRLPDVSGFEVCEQIKADPVRGTTPVIHVSAAAIHTVDRTRGLSQGADAYLVEPIDPDELLATVAAILRYYQARLQAEALAGRLAELARVSAAMVGATSQRGVLREAAGGGAHIFDAPFMVIATGADGGRLAALAAGPGEPVDVRASMVDLSEAPPGVTVTDQAPDRWPQLRWPAGDTVRVLTLRQRPDHPPVCVATATSVTMPGAPVLTLFAQAVLSALETMRLYDEEHDLALTLQNSLLPRLLPAVPELEFAVRYVPASDRAEIGGDFYEVVRIGDNLMIAVGDVGGHSLHAATIMGEVRHATRAYLVEGHGPAAVLDRLNHLLAELIPGEIATMCLVAVDMASGRCRLANAGHPPPLHATPAGVRVLADRSPLLGIVVRPAAEVEFTLDPGDTLVLYTDGLVETREETLDASLRRLVEAAGTVEDDLEAFASRLLSDVGPAVPGDDVAMVVVRRKGPVG